MRHRVVVSLVDDANHVVLPNEEILKTNGNYAANFECSVTLRVHIAIVVSGVDRSVLAIEMRWTCVFGLKISLHFHL